MRERPILFSAPMIRALLAGTKTQTRRAVKPAPRRPVDFVGGGPKGGPDWNNPECWGYECDDGWVLLKAGKDADELQYPCPYGWAGDRLWVRETLKPWTQDTALFAYAADDTRVQGDGMNYPVIGRKYVPSIHLERCWSRLLLDITGIRVERLQDISEQDALAEGYPRDWMPGGDGHWCSPKQWYADLWKDINGPDSWDANPFVWVVEFKRTESK